jgi:hypothetical protein
VPTDPNPSVFTYDLYATCSEGAMLIMDTDAGVIHTRLAGPQLTANPVKVTLNGCKNGLADMLVATNDDNLDLLDYIYQPQVSVGTSSTGSGTSVTLAGTYAAMPNLTELVTDAPANTQSYRAGITISTPLGVLYGNGNPDGNVPGSGSSVSLVVPTPPIPDGVAMTTFDVTPGSNVFDSQTIDTWGASPAATVTLDYAATQLFDFATTPAFAVANQSFTWSVGTVGNAPDAVSGAIDVQREVGSATMQWTWNIVAPGSENGSLALPTLPTDLFDFNVGAGDTAIVASSGAAAAPGGYDAFRGLWFGANFAFDQILSDTGSGTIVTEDYFNDNSDARRRSRRGQQHER